MVKLICTNCLKNYGVRRTAEKYGIKDDTVCKNCGSTDGLLIDLETTKKIQCAYIIDGTRVPYELPTPFHMKEDKIEINNTITLQDATEIADFELLNSIHGFYVSHRFVKTFEVGNSELADMFSDFCDYPFRNEFFEINKSYEEKFEFFLNYFPLSVRHTGTKVYRIRKNPSDPSNNKEYDAPPIEKCIDGRMNYKGHPAFYGAFEIDTCIYESKIGSEDNIFLMEGELTRDISLLNLLNVLNIQQSDSQNIYETLEVSYFIHYLFNTNYWSRFSQELSLYLKNKGIEGVIYPSYFNRVRPTTYTNFAIFGHPIESGLINVVSKNRLIINQIGYDYSFGPVLKPNQ